MREISLYLLLSHLLVVGFGSTCFPVDCLNCDASKTLADACDLCPANKTKCENPKNVSSHCKKDFKLSVNSSKAKPEEGDAITLTCVDDVPSTLNFTYGWKKNEKIIKGGKNMKKLVLKKVLSNKAGKYTCFVNGSCGYHESPPHDVTVGNQSVVILVICGVAALALVVVMGLAMKFKLKRDNAKHRERMKQRARAEQSAGPAPFTPRES
ncbi:uncharacterized protein LOC121948540 [Plectropomus leopardus]|uniref:uncharacterized protein LOC121948540 n=1 Tax=Plectropomus leopardus TaxID=160734 RepID=UPI001C4D7330|nr:uncharacterized protein LOC121948540 [Plectropomus leopardus]